MPFLEVTLQKTLVVYTCAWMGVAKSHGALLSEYGDSPETLDSRNIQKRAVSVISGTRTPYDIHWN